MWSRRAFVTGALGAGAGVFASGGAESARANPLWASPLRAFLPTQAAPPTLADFFRSPQVGDAALSPRGLRVAILGQAAPTPGAPPEAFIDVFDAIDPSLPSIRTPLPDLGAETIDWASEDRLLVWVVTARRPNPAKPGEDVTLRRVIAMDPDGGRPVILFERSDDVGAFNLTEIVDPLIDDADHVVMTAWNADFDVAGLYRVNVRSGKAELLERGDASTVSWRCQAGSPVLRYDMDRGGKVMSLLAREPGDDRWRVIRRVHRDEVKDFQVVGSTPSPGVVLVSARGDDEDANAVRTLDTRTMTLGPALSARPNRDVAKVLTGVRDRFVAAGYYEDRLSYDFVQPRMAAHFKLLNRLYDDACNIELLKIDESQTRWLARVSGPREPGAYILYDTERKQPQVLGRMRPWLKPDSLAAVEALEVRTRDGEKIQAYLTKPLGRGPRPLVVMPHGGPEIRDHMGYDPWAQVLAAQGWLVLQPNFRGSGGYGRAFAEAGWKRWGDRMQEDVEDCVDLLIRQKRVDPDRIAIFGASYGGYAALMGAVRRPSQYKAVVAAAAPTDLPQLMRFEKKRQKDDPAVFAFWRDRIGDPAADTAAMAAASPRLRAGEITAPVLLIHGVRDDVVPVAQTRLMAQALKAAGKPCDVYEMKIEGHSNWGLPAERVVMQKVVDFLKPALA